MIRELARVDFGDRKTDTRSDEHLLEFRICLLVPKTYIRMMNALLFVLFLFLKIWNYQERVLLLSEILFVLLLVLCSWNYRERFISF